VFFSGNGVFLGLFEENFPDCNNFFYNEMNGGEQKYFGGKANGFSSEIYENLPTKNGFS